MLPIRPPPSQPPLHLATAGEERWKPMHLLRRWRWGFSRQRHVDTGAGHGIAVSTRDSGSNILVTGSDAIEAGSTQSDGGDFPIAAHGGGRQGRGVAWVLLQPTVCGSVGCSLRPSWSLLLMATPPQWRRRNRLSPRLTFGRLNSLPASGHRLATPSLLCSSWRMSHQASVAGDWE